MGTVEKIFKKQADPTYLRLLQSGRDFAERQVSRHKRHGQLATCKQHREVRHTATIGKEFGLPRKPETDLVHPRLVNWPSHNGLNFTAECECGAFFQGFEGRVSRLLCRLA